MAHTLPFPFHSWHLSLKARRTVEPRGGGGTKQTSTVSFCSVLGLAERANCCPFTAPAQQASRAGQRITGSRAGEQQKRRLHLLSWLLLTHCFHNTPDFAQVTGYFTLQGTERHSTAKSVGSSVPNGNLHAAGAGGRWAVDEEECPPSSDICYQNGRPLGACPSAVMSCVVASQVRPGGRPMINT